MATLRFQALQEVLRRQAVKVDYPSQRISEYFGINVFDPRTMQKYLSQEAYKSVQKSIQMGTRIDRKMADEVAAGMKAWATERGATHYTHWFHPLTDATAEKHDAFIEFSDDGSVIESFSGDRLDTIAGIVPDPLHFPQGCKFHPRCSRGCDDKRCQSAEPELREVGSGRCVACWYAPGYEEAGS